MNDIIDAINSWRIEDGKGAVIDAWSRAGRFRAGRFPVWAWRNRGGRFWKDQIREIVSNFKKDSHARPTDSE